MQACNAYRPGIEVQDFQTLNSVASIATHEKKDSSKMHCWICHTRHIETCCTCFQASLGSIQLATEGKCLNRSWKALNHLSSRASTASPSPSPKALQPPRLPWCSLCGRFVHCQAMRKIWHGNSYTCLFMHAVVQVWHEACGVNLLEENQKASILTVPRANQLSVPEPGIAGTELCWCI